MNLLIVGNLYPPFIFGGYEILCAQVVEELRRRGHRVSILTSRYGLDFQSLPPEPGITRTLELTTSFPKPGEDVGYVDFRLSSLQRVGWLNRQATAEVLEAASPRFDLVFCWCLNRLGLGPVFATRERGIRVAWTINDEHPKQYRCVQGVWSPRALIRRVLERWLFPLATLRNLPPFPVTIIAEALKKRLLQQETPIGHAEVIYQGIAVDRMDFRTAPWEPGHPFRLLYVGQLSRAKGVHTIIEALAQLRTGSPEKAYELTIVGSGVPEYLSELQATAAEGMVTDRVRFTGKIPREEVAGFQHSHHGFVFSSEWEEPFGLAHLEAMAYGNPVVSTTTGGSAELIRDGENALAYRAGDAHHLASRLQELAADEAKRVALAVRARRYVEAHHSFLGYVDRIEDFLRRAGSG